MNEEHINHLFSVQGSITPAPPTICGENTGQHSKNMPQ